MTYWKAFRRNSGFFEHGRAWGCIKDGVTARVLYGHFSRGNEPEKHLRNNGAAGIANKYPYFLASMDRLITYRPEIVYLTF